MTTEKSPRITLDTNVCNLVADPEQYASLCSPEISREIRDAIIGGKIMAFVSEASIFIECLSFEDKLAYLNVAMTPKERPAPDPRRVAIFDEVARLGVMMLHAPLIAAEIFIDGFLWASDEVYSQADRLQRFGAFIRRYPGHAPLQALGEAKLKQQKVPPGSNLSIPPGYYMTGPAEWRRAFKREWDAGDAAGRKALRKEVEPLIGEWCDELIVGSHFAYGNDYFCSVDRGSGAGANSLLHHSNRSALARDSVIVIAPPDLVKLLA
jgi:hypothetical protein